MSTLIPAYGRDYKSKKAVLEDFNADKDFILCDISDPYDGKYCNKSDLKKAGKRSVSIRYKNKTMIAVVSIGLLFLSACSSSVAYSEKTCVNDRDLVVAYQNTQEKLRIAKNDLNFAQELVWEMQAIIEQNTEVQLHNCFRYPYTVSNCQGEEIYEQYSE